MSSRVTHMFTVDVEDYFQVVAFEPIVRRTEWATFPGRVEATTRVLLDLLQRHRATATFFTLGWVAEKYPGLVREIVSAGHEVASHGWWHRRVSQLSQEEFREEVRASKRLLEDLTGVPVLGYRAPSFSIRPGMEWAFDVLLAEGYQYDSSIFPIRRPDYGYPGAPIHPYQIHRPAGTLLELPLATLDCLGLRVPAAGGGYLRQLPYQLTESAFAQLDRRGIPGMFYVHPWEVDPDQPRLPASWLTRLRHYRGLGLTLPRIERLLKRFSFASVAALRPGLLPMTVSAA